MGAGKIRKLALKLESRCRGEQHAERRETGMRERKVPYVIDGSLIDGICGLDIVQEAIFRVLLTRDPRKTDNTTPVITISDTTETIRELSVSFIAIFISQHLLRCGHQPPMQREHLSFTTTAFGW
jgi:hypothetical protein